jgi:anti-anti-sigma factor
MTTLNQRSWGYGLPDQVEPPGVQPDAAATPQTGGRPWLRHLRGDFVGALAAVIMTIPTSMGYGLLALSSLGDAVVPQAILAGLYAPIFGCIVAVLLGANTTMIYSPRSIVTFLIGALVLDSIARSNLAFLQAAAPAVLLGVAFLMVFMAGLFQALFGLFRLGELVRYIPAPVIAGFQNAAAILIFFSQIDNMLGLERHVALADLPAAFANLQPLTLLVGVVTCVLILKGARITRRIPPTIFGLVCGVALYYLLAAAGFGAGLSPAVGAIPFSLPSLHYFVEFAGLVTNPAFAKVLPVLIGGALSLAIVASLDGMLCARLIESDSGNRIEANRELARIGIGNMVTAGFGGIANGINLASSFANHRSGARTPLSLLFHAGFLLLAVLVLSPLIAYIPRVVIAAMLVVVAIQLVDRWTLQICLKLLKRQFASTQNMLLDLTIILFVTIAAVAINIVFAVLIGVTVTVLFFLLRMSKSVIRRSYRCDAVRSRKTRDEQLMELLSKHGAEILVFELEGPLFFGTAENLAAEIDRAMLERTTHLIFDLKRVNDVDSTGAKVLLQAHDRLAKAGKFLVLSALEERTQVANVLKDMGVTTALTRSRIFHDTDRAIEWAEERVIFGHLGEVKTGGEFPFDQLDVLAGMDTAELDVIKSALSRRTYQAGAMVFAEGDESRELYIVAMGSASARLRLPGTERQTRLISFSPGTVFGELALLDQEARSASVEADENLVCYVLTRDSFDRLTAQYPAIAIKLLTNLGRELASHLRRANRTINQLAS